LFSHVQKVSGSVDSAELPHVRNKLAQTLAFLFVLTYAESWTSFFDDFLRLGSSSGSPVGNASGIDMYLRVLLVIHEEIGDNLIIRDVEQTKRNNALKDLVRVRSVSQLANSWMSILEYYSSGNGESIPQQSEVLSSVLRVIGGWVSWIDISLIVQPAFLNLIFGQLANSKQRLGACDCLVEIISKKMKPSEKLELIALLNLTSVLSQLPTWSDLEFDERVAKLANVVGLELVHICDGSTTQASGVACSSDEMARSERLLIDLFPTIFNFLSNEYDDTSLQVIPCLTDYVQFIRKEVRATKPDTDIASFLGQERTSILFMMLNKVIIKSKYDSSAEWSGGQDESESEFLDMRAKLKVLQDQIASISMDLYVQGMSTVIKHSLDNSSTKSWQDVELGLYEISAFTDTLRNGAVVTVRGMYQDAQNALYELFAKMITSNVVAINHPSIQLWYMELVNKLSHLFKGTQPELLNKVLEVFVSPLGVHNSNGKVQVRSWYLFFRFLKTVHGFVGDIGETVLNSISDLLTIKAEIITKDDDSELSGDEAAESGSFDSQLYLFELCGMLFGQAEDNHGHELTRRLLQPIYSDIEKNLSDPQDQTKILQVHHDIMAIGTFARGFDDLNSPTIGSRKAIQEFKNSAEAILVVLERLPSVEIIRDAARFAFARLIPLLKVELLPHLSRLISTLLTQSKMEEFVDFLGFLGQLIHSFKSESGVFDMFTSLFTPLVERVFIILNEVDANAASGSTDAVVFRREIRRSYLQFLFNVLNNGMGAIFIAEQNREAFGSVIQSIFHYASDFDDQQTQKAAITCLSKLLGTLGGGKVKAEIAGTLVFGEGQPVSGFDDSFIFEQYSRLCWELPGKPGFNSKDAQVRLILNDVAGLQRTLFRLKGTGYVTYLADQYFPMIGLPQSLAQEYLQNLCQTTEGKQFKKFYIDFISRISS
jgi:exportin-T